jgi:hypothetical protein
VLVQAHIGSTDELRVHVVEGRLLEGATTGRWNEIGRYTTEETIRSAESAVRGMLIRAKSEAPRLSCGLDLLVTAAGHCIVDLNAGLESGMYQPENDVYVTNLLAARYSGADTPYLRDLRAFRSAPLRQKLLIAKRMDDRIGEFVRRHEAEGFYDQIIGAYIDDVRSANTDEAFHEAWRQISQLPIDEYQRERFLSEASRSYRGAA